MSERQEQIDLSLFSVDMAEIEQEIEQQEKETKYDGTRISTGSDFVDKSLLGGIPLGSLSLFEGTSGSGKSVMLQHLSFGALMADLLVVYFSSNRPTETLVSMMEELGLQVAEDIRSEQLRIVPLNELDGWGYDYPSFLDVLLLRMKELLTEGVDLVVIDDFTLPVSHSPSGRVVNFLAQCKEIARQGMTIVVAMHTSAADKKLMKQMNLLFDSHISLSIEGKKYGMQMKLMNLMEIRKVENIQLTQKNTVYFRVNTELAKSMNISIDVVPIFKVKV